MASQFVRVLANYISSRMWAYRVEKRRERYSDAEILAAVTNGQSWENYWSQFAKNFPSRFFYSPRNQKDFFLQTLQSLHPYEEILDDANDAVNRTFDLLGSGPVTLATPIDWSRDFTSGGAVEK